MPIIGLAGCGIRMNMEAGIGMKEVLMATSGMKVLQLEWDLLDLADRM